MSSAAYTIELRPAAQGHLTGISDKRVQKKIGEAIDDLMKDPGAKGKPLAGMLRGYRSKRAVGQRYRLVYRIDEAALKVVVVAIGIRKDGDKKDAYALAKKLWRNEQLG